MNKPRILALGAIVLVLAGCTSDATAPIVPSHAVGDGGAYMGAGYDTQATTPPMTTDTTHRGGAYLGAGFDVNAAGSGLFGSGH